MKTDPQTVNRFLIEARNCAMQMMENACFIQKELPSIDMPDSLREQITKLCNDLIGTKHDLINETFEVGDLMESSPESPAIAQKIGHMRQWIVEDTMSFHGCVKDVQQTVEQGKADGLLSILLMESAVNILTAVPSAPESEKETKTEPDDDEESDEESDEEDDDDGCHPNCYAFYSEDSYPVGLLIAAIRKLMARPDLPADTVADLKVFLFAMVRLPLVTPGVRMSLGLRIDQGGESDWIEIRMEDGEFTLGRGSWVDGDADTKTVFEVTPDYREGDAFVATQFAESFAECARDVCREVVIEDFSDEPFTRWDLKPDKKRWGSLPCSFL